MFGPKIDFSCVRMWKNLERDPLIAIFYLGWLGVQVSARWVSIILQPGTLKLNQLHEQTILWVARSYNFLPARHLLFKLLLLNFMSLEDRVDTDRVMIHK